MSLVFQELRGQSALTVGLRFVPVTALISMMNVLSGKVTNRYEPRPPMLAGLLILLPVDTGTPGVLLALAVPPLTAAALEAVPTERAGRTFWRGCGRAWSSRRC